jgi:hypothetical protein
MEIAIPRAYGHQLTGYLPVSTSEPTRLDTDQVPLPIAVKPYAGVGLALDELGSFGLRSLRLNLRGRRPRIYNLLDIYCI